MKEIITELGAYEYKEVPLYYGRKLIDIDICTKNLLDFKDLMDKKNLKFGIIYGTLLGAVREKNFIEYDEDVDVYVLDENKELFLNLLFEFRSIEFEVARYDGALLSLIRDNDYIDIYFFRKNFLGKRVCNGDSLPNSFFKSYDEIKFLNTRFNTPKDYILFLEFSYGKDWEIPKKNTPASVSGNLVKFKKNLNNYFPNVYKFLKLTYRFILNKKDR